LPVKPRLTLGGKPTTRKAAKAAFTEWAKGEDWSIAVSPPVSLSLSTIAGLEGKEALANEILKRAVESDFADTVWAEMNAKVSRRKKVG
jgi:hypothetical protein